MNISSKRKGKTWSKLPGGYSATITEATGFDRGELHSLLGNAAFPQWLPPSTHKRRKPRGYNG